jgi:hypothetical protein
MGLVGFFSGALAVVHVLDRIRRGVIVHSLVKIVRSQVVLGHMQQVDRLQMVLDLGVGTKHYS